MDRRLEEILDLSITDLQSGKSLEEVLAKYPDDALELKPLLQMAMQLDGLPDIEPSRAGLSDTLIRIGQETALKRRRFAPRISWLPRQPKLAWAAAAVLALMVSFTGVTSLSASSAPGDFLYPIKLVSEKVRFLLTVNSENKAELRLTFSEERLNELLKLSQRSGSIDTTLLKEMLTQAELALERADVPAEQAIPFLSRLQLTNTYQQKMLEQIRPDLDSASRIYVDRAIETCCNRGQWLTEILAKEQGQGRTSQPSPRETDRSSKQSWDWGPGCSCN